MGCLQQMFPETPRSVLLHLPFFPRAVPPKMQWIDPKMWSNAALWAKLLFLPFLSLLGGYVITACWPRASCIWINGRPESEESWGWKGLGIRAVVSNSSLSIQGQRGKVPGLAQCRGWDLAKGSFVSTGAVQWGQVEGQCWALTLCHQSLTTANAVHCSAGCGQQEAACGNANVLLLLGWDWALSSSSVYIQIEFKGRWPKHSCPGTGQEGAISLTFLHSQGPVSSQAFAQSIFQDLA